MSVLGMVRDMYACAERLRGREAERHYVMHVCVSVDMVTVMFVLTLTWLVSLG